MAGARCPGLYFLPSAWAGLIALFALERLLVAPLPYRVGSIDFGHCAAVWCVAVLLIIGVPVAFALSAASLATVLYSACVARGGAAVAAGASLTTLIAIPLFIFAGEMMMRGGYRTG